MANIVPVKYGDQSLRNVNRCRESARVRTSQLSETGSGVAHRLPRGMVCTMPVPEHHRGRLFHPFADGDPKTAEVISDTLRSPRDSDKFKTRRTSINFVTRARLRPRYSASGIL
jgi:hypothetical protein